VGHHGGVLSLKFIEQVDESTRLEKQPEGLKPRISAIVYGTAKAVPLQRIKVIGQRIEFIGRP
jgi:hypothetical protein